MAYAMLSMTDRLPLPNSPHKIPQLGFGIYQSRPEVCINSCKEALKAGYKHIDSAQFYQNEKEMGIAARDSGIPRSELFLTTKILSSGGSPEKTYEKCLDSVRKIAGDDEGAYVDLFLIHSPSAGKAARKEMWNALERLVKEGKAKAIGVSNYGIGHISEMTEYKTEVFPPHVNQIELHPWCQQKEIVNYCMQNEIVIEAYCPLVRNQKAHDETLLKMAKKHGVTTAQILVRYSLQKGWVCLPKSDTPERIVANADGESSIFFLLSVSRE